MESWKARLLVEHKELEDRIYKLGQFLSRISPAEIQGYDLMVCQYHAMKAYEQALLGRMKLYGIVEK